MLIYDALNLPIFQRIPSSARRILDLGCGAGHLGARVKAQSNVIVHGVTFSAAEAEQGGRVLDQVEVADLNQWVGADEQSYDCVICSHVLEHLYRPERLLHEVRRLLVPTGCLLVALPNILHWRQRVEFMRGRFRYTDGGLMDRTHYRFYDWSSARSLLTDHGFIVVEQRAEGSVPLPGVRRVLPKGLARKIDELGCQKAPGLFGAQFVFVCQPIASGQNGNT